jgi:hypothetical protein
LLGAAFVSGQAQIACDFNFFPKASKDTLFHRLKSNQKVGAGPALEIGLSIVEPEGR